ncbi:MAG: phosphate/phosphite/phosphonate ABC transporter substrate-binding protein [Candidatus Ornithospirochaeta sp.]|nr:phosphate/phosphite/phosphonate ABC transporter substrate-binding protein [Candidatus Ornithospirochaeta sp.]
MKRLFAVLLVLTLAVAAVLANGASESAKAEEVRYGELDPIYVDKNGDMVADPPEDPSQWLDPDTLIFAYAPVEDPAVYEEVFVDFQRHLEEVTGKKVKWFAVTNYATQIEAMRAGRLHVSGFAAGTVQDAVNTGGFVPMAVMGTADGFVGYRMAIITYKGSGIKTIEDLRGKNIAFVSESSNSGYSAPRALLYQNFGILPGKDYQVSFSGKHDNSITGVYNKDYDAGAIADTVLARMVAGERVPDPAEWCEFIYQSDIFPPTAWGVNYRLKPELQEKVREAFLTYNWEGTLMQQTWPEDDRFIPVDYAKDYAVLRTIREGSEKVAEILGE